MQLHLSTWPDVLFRCACLAVVVALPTVAIYTKRGRQVLQSHPQRFRIVGGAIMVVALLVIFGFSVFATVSTSVPREIAVAADWLFAAGLAIFGTPTLFSIAQSTMRSKEEE